MLEGLVSGVVSSRRSTLGCSQISGATATATTCTRPYRHLATHPTPIHAQSLHYQWFADFGNVDAAREAARLLAHGASRDYEAAARYLNQVCVLVLKWTGGAREGLDWLELTDSSAPACCCLWRLALEGVQHARNQVPAPPAASNHQCCHPALWRRRRLRVIQRPWRTWVTCTPTGRVCRRTTLRPSHGLAKQWSTVRLGRWGQEKRWKWFMQPLPRPSAPPPSPTHSWPSAALSSPAGHPSGFLALGYMHLSGGHGLPRDYGQVGARGSAFLPALGSVWLRLSVANLPNAPPHTHITTSLTIHRAGIAILERRCGGGAGHGGRRPRLERPGGCLLLPGWVAA